MTRFTEEEVETAGPSQQQAGPSCLILFFYCFGLQIFFPDSLVITRITYACGPTLIQLKQGHFKAAHEVDIPIIKLFKQFLQCWNTGKYSKPSECPKKGRFKEMGL